MARKSIKRENGTGSVYKRKDLKRRPWVAVAPAELIRDDDAGKVNAKQMIIGHYSTAQEAKDALDEYRRNPTTKYNITLAELHGEWKEIAYRSISKQTKDNYDACWIKLEPLYAHKFREIRTAQMQAVIDLYGNMSHSTLSKIKALLTQLYDYAMQNDIVNKNYAKFIILPKQEKSTKDCFTDLELEKIKKAAGVIPFADVILMMCYTGFRVSEFLELTQFSYDTATNALKGGKKTDAGRGRVVPVHDAIQPYLMAWIAKNGKAIICTDTGDPYTADKFRRQCYYPALDAIGIRRLSPHATRHTFATRLSAAGARTEDIQALAGHEDYEVTANTYIHQDIKTLRAAIEKLS
nr:MAG TPA: Integrase [Caudoviricetes sp.]